MTTCFGRPDITESMTPIFTYYHLHVKKFQMGFNRSAPLLNLGLTAFNSSLSINCNFCRKYGVNIIIDLHAAPDSQNGYEHSSSRDGSQEWGATDANIQQTVAVIEFLTAR